MSRLLTTLLGIVLLIAIFASVASPVAAKQNGFILRGTLTSAASDGSHYFNVGEAFVFMLPKDSALLQGVRALEGRKVVISIIDDAGQ